MQTAEIAEHRAADHHVMEVRDDKISVGQMHRQAHRTEEQAVGRAMHAIRQRAIDVVDSELRAVVGIDEIADAADAYFERADEIDEKSGLQQGL